MTPIYRLVDALPETNLTTRVMGAIDLIAPGDYKNIVGFKNMLREVTRSDDEKYLKLVAERAIKLYNDRSQGYQRALWLYQKGETVSNTMATAALANKAGESWSFLSLLTRVTPKADTSQTIDVCTKLAIEMVAFCYSHGFPGDSISDFMKALANYRDDSYMRMACVICIDGVLPLGPDFMQKVISLVEGTGSNSFVGSSVFSKVQSLIPGAGVNDKIGFMKQGMNSIRGWVESFIGKNGITSDKILSSVKGFIDGADDKLDYVAATLDLTTNTFLHTGTQSVARTLIERASNEV